MLFEHTDYRSYLKAVLADRIGRNPAYSLRRMASQMGMSHPALSNVLNGKRNLSYEAALRVSQQLQLENRESEYFCHLVQLELARKPEAREAILGRISSQYPQTQVRDLSVDLYRSMSEWYYTPILEMTRLAGFQFTPRNVAHRLGISITEAEVAIERLLRLELLVKNGRRFSKATDYTVARGPGNAGAIRKFNQKMLEKALTSIETHAPEERSGGTETFAISPAQLPRARRLMDEFLSSMARLSECASPSEIYHVNVQLFSLTPKKKKKNRKNP
jgi:uncharacterized protein (TIGR02147 family)